MNSKHRVHNFWSYFLTIQQPLETALREQDVMNMSICSMISMNS